MAHKAQRGTSQLPTMIAQHAGDGAVGADGAVERRLAHAVRGVHLKAAGLGQEEVHDARRAPRRREVECRRARGGDGVEDLDRGVAQQVPECEAQQYSMCVLNTPTPLVPPRGPSTMPPPDFPWGCRLSPGQRPKHPCTSRIVLLGPAVPPNFRGRNKTRATVRVQAKHDLAFLHTMADENTCTQKHQYQGHVP